VKLKVQTLDGKNAGADIELSEDVFGLDPRADILHRVVTWQREKARGTARPTRERSDVARTGKKFGKQKGGGTARHGDRAAPIFIGGGKAHGARLRDFNPSLNKKVRTLGLKMALSDKAKSDKIIVLDTLEMQDAKTKALKEQAAGLGFGKRTLVIDGETVDAGFKKASANLYGIDILPAIGANVYDILRAETLVLTRAGLEKLEARFNG
jgi:large subunit ribosomal protein L4